MNENLNKEKLKLALPIVFILSTFFLAYSIFYVSIYINSTLTYATIHNYHEEFRPNKSGIKTNVEGKKKVYVADIMWNIDNSFYKGKKIFNDVPQIGGKIEIRYSKENPEKYIETSKIIPLLVVDIICIVISIVLIKKYFNL